MEKKYFAILAAGAASALAYNWFWGEVDIVGQQAENTIKVADGLNLLSISEQIKELKQNIIQADKSIKDQGQRLVQLEKILDGSMRSKACIDSHSFETAIKMLNDVYNANKNAEITAKFAELSLGFMPQDIENILIPAIVITSMTCCHKDGYAKPGEDCKLPVSDWQKEFEFPANACPLIDGFCEFTHYCMDY